MLLVCRDCIYRNSIDSRYLLSCLVCSKTMDSFLPSFLRSDLDELASRQPWIQPTPCLYMLNVSLIGVQTLDRPPRA